MPRKETFEDKVAKLNKLQTKMLSTFSLIAARLSDRCVFILFGHFAASALISAGLDITTVSGALGHSCSGTTLNCYSHMLQTAQAKVDNAMDGAFGFLNTDNKNEQSV